MIAVGDEEDSLSLSVSPSSSGLMIYGDPRGATQAINIPFVKYATGDKLLSALTPFIFVCHFR